MYILYYCGVPIPTTGKCVCGKRYSFSKKNYTTTLCPLPNIENAGERLRNNKMSICVIRRLL